MTKLHLLLTASLLASPLSATEKAPQTYPLPQVYPIPQQVELTPFYTKIKTAEYMQLDPQRPQLGVPKIPHKEGAYAIVIKPERLSVYSYDEVGRYYAKQSIIQLLRGARADTLSAQQDPLPNRYFEAVSRSGELPLGTIIDWPDLPYRGVVEGYYGTPWTLEERMNQIEFYGRNKINTYIWAPKDDPYHHGEQAHVPYPAKMAAQISELCKHAEKHHVKFVWAIHPANSVDWDKGEGKPDMDRLVKKLELMYDLGVRHFGVFVDDSEGEIKKAHRQARLCTYLTENFIDKKHGLDPLIMCPSGYSRLWTPEPWLKELGEKLPPSVPVMWTGDYVASEIHLEGQQWVSRALGRPTFIWWNWPCSDYNRSQLALGRTYSLSQDPQMKQLLSGFVANPMEWPEASKLGLFGVGDYAWNIEQFNSAANWRAGVKRLFPSNPIAMQLFAEHNSDLGTNGDGFTREESEIIAPTLLAITSALDENKPIDPQHLKTLTEHFAHISTAATKLLTDEKLSKLQQEIAPWMHLFGAMGDLGTSFLDALSLSDKKQLSDALLTIIAKTAQVEQHRDGAKKPLVGGKLLVPFLRRLAGELNAQMQARLTGREKLWAQPRFSSTLKANPHMAHCMHDPSEQSVWIQHYAQEAGHTYTLDYGSPRQMERVTLIMGGKRPAEYIVEGQMEYSQDGSTWQLLGSPTRGARVDIELPEDAPLTARYLRYRILSLPEEKRWVSIAFFGINHDSDFTRVSTDIPSWKNGKLQLNHDKDGYHLKRIMEVASMPPTARVALRFPSIAQAEELVLDLETPLEPWAVLKLHSETSPTGEQLIPLHRLKRDAKRPTRYSLSAAELPARLTGITLYNASTHPVDIKLRELALRVPAGDKQDTRALTDNNFLPSWECANREARPLSLKNMTHIPLPKDTGKVVIFASRKPDYVFGSKPETGLARGITADAASAGNFYEYTIPAGSTALSIASSASQPAYSIYEIYFIPTTTLD